MFNHIRHEFPQLLQENADGKRVYVAPNGEKYPSVTTVIADHGKEAILEWRKKVGEEKANEISRKATTRGTSVHKALEMYLKNEDVSSLEMMPNVKSLFVRMKQELDEKVNNIHCLEDRLFSHELKLAGTVDCIAEYKGVLSVIDFKTSIRLKKKENISGYFMQGAAYATMFNEMTSLNIDFKTSIRLKKKENISGYFMQGAAYATMFNEMTSLNIDQIVILIGVDTANFCQTMIVRGDEIHYYRQELQKYIDSYWQKA